MFVHFKGKVWYAVVFITDLAQKNNFKHTLDLRNCLLNEGLVWLVHEMRVSEAQGRCSYKTNFAGQQQAPLHLHMQLLQKYSLVYCRQCVHKESTPPLLCHNSKAHVTRECVPAESSCQQIFSVFISSSLLYKLSAIFSQVVMWGLLEIVAILLPPVIHLVSKYGHYEGTVAWGLCGKLMADRKGQKRQDRWLCHHHQPDAMRELQCLFKCHSVP